MHKNRTRMNFYLLESEDENYKKCYVQKLTSSSTGDEICLTYWPEYAARCLNYLEVEKLRVLVEVVDNFVNKIGPWKVVKYNMDMDQQTWAAQPKEMVEYKNELGKVDEFTPEQLLELDEYRAKVELKYSKKKKEAVL